MDGRMFPTLKSTENVSKDYSEISPGKYVGPFKRDHPMLRMFFEDMFRECEGKIVVVTVEVNGKGDNV